MEARCPVCGFRNVGIERDATYIQCGQCGHLFEYADTLIHKKQWKEDE